MQRRLHAITLALVMLACAWSAGSHRAAAQPSNCCTYTVDIAGISSECLPITIEGDFGPGGRDTVTLTGDTVMIRAVPGPCPAYLLNWISINGMIPIPATGFREITIGDCCYRFEFIVDQNICYTIRIRPCQGGGPGGLG